MRRTVRIALTWLLAAALPLQALATAGGLGCAAHRAAPAHEAAAGHDDEHHHAAGHDQLHDHAAAGSGHRLDHAAAGHDQLHDHAATGNEHRHDHARAGHDHPRHPAAAGTDAAHACSACAACCLGAAMPAALLVFDPVVLRDRQAPAPAGKPPAYLTEGLERPPRPVPA